VPSRSWSEAVTDAVARHVANTGSIIFTRGDFIEGELDNIVADTGSAGVTPHQTLSRELQQLRDLGLLEFVGQGVYRWLGHPIEPPRLGTSKGVFVVGSHSIYRDEPERFYCFPLRWMPNASKVIGNWIIYQEPRRAGPRGY
jgi:putative restriction endonuclease